MSSPQESQKSSTTPPTIKEESMPVVDFEPNPTTDVGSAEEKEASTEKSSIDGPTTNVASVGEKEAFTEKSTNEKPTTIPTSVSLILSNNFLSYSLIPDYVPLSPFPLSFFISCILFDRCNCIPSF